MSSSIAVKDIEFVTIKLPTKNTLPQVVLLVNSNNIQLNLLPV